jgi:hypothetical protein
VRNELKSMLKEAVVDEFKPLFPQIFHEGLRKTMINMGRFITEAERDVDMVSYLVVL